MNSRKKGYNGENLAISYLLKNKYTILEHNYYSPFGEIDIIAKKDNIIVFIEVKYRKPNSSIKPEESINKQKLYKIYKTAQYYLMKNNYSELSLRFDFIGISNNKINHIKNILQEDTL